MTLHHPYLSVLSWPALLFASSLALFAQGTAVPAAGSDPQPGQVQPGQTEPALPAPDKRVFGVLPNYRTANSTAVYMPITPKQKLTIASKDSFDYPLVGLAAVL